MTRVSLFGVVVLGALSIAAADPVIQYLQELQSASGGFHEPASEVADLEATSHALFLSSLYGLKHKINADDAAQFVQSLGNANDFGYGLAAGSPSDLHSTRYALASYIHLGKAIPDSQKVSDFVRSLSDVRTGLFAARAGESGDYRSTALAIEALDLTNELQKPVVQEVLKRIKDSLSEKVVSTDASIRFSLDAQSQTPVSDNYYAIYLAKKSGYKFSDVEKWAAYITAQQDLDRQSATYGGFFANTERTLVTAEATAHAAMSLALLGQEAGNEYALYAYTQSRKSTIKETAQSHLAFAHARLFKRAFSTRVAYDADANVDVTSQFMEGLRVLPIAMISGLDGKIQHGGFRAIVKEASGWQSEMEFNANRGIYVAKQDFDTTGKFGPVAFSFEFVASVFPIGEVKLSNTDQKTIGYQMHVNANAVYAGREIQAGENVPAGTEFNFDVSFSTRAKSQFVSGDFVVDFEVIDSSEVVHFKTSLDGSSNSKPITFNYALSGDDFTSGAVNFLLTVRNDDGAHSTHSVRYTLDQQMVASQISFEGASRKFKIGDAIKVTMQPATLKNLHTVAAFSADNAAKRTFVLDLATADGTTFLTVPGTPSGSQFTFEATVPATLDVTGSSIVSFRFVPVNGDAITLHPFDSDKNELLEDANSIQVSVDTEFHVSKFEKKPTTTSFTFGTEIPFEFVITDSVSGKDVSAGKLGQVAIVLTSGNYESGRVVATAAEGKPFSAVLAIDANTVKGDGEITIKASVKDTQIPLFAEGKKEAVKFPASVGGDIAVTKSVYTTDSAYSTKTAFLASFSLSCNGKAFKNSHLRATVVSTGGNGVVERYGAPLQGLPVSFDAEGKYSFSFAAPHDAVKSGSYKVEFRRESDLARARAQGAESSLAPLFSVELSHKAVNTESSWAQMELATFLILAALFFGVSGNARFFKSSKKNN